MLRLENSDGRPHFCREGAALHWIGAAVVSLWPKVPHDLQESILHRALAMAQNDPDINAQIKAFTKLNGERGTAPSP